MTSKLFFSKLFLERLFQNMFYEARIYKFENKKKCILKKMFQNDFALFEECKDAGRKV